MVGVVRKGKYHELPSTPPEGAGKLAWTSAHNKGALARLLPTGERYALYYSSDTHQLDIKMKMRENIQCMNRHV